eukprot:730253_1
MVDKPISITQRLDDAVAQYYKDCGRNDYFDEESGVGKFVKFVNQNGFEDEDVCDELAEEPDECTLTDFDPMFPLRLSTNESRANDILQVLKHCYKYGVAPPPVSLIWQPVANALKHELYDKIASTFMVIVNESNKQFENLNE